MWPAWYCVGLPPFPAGPTGETARPDLHCGEFKTAHASTHVALALHASRQVPLRQLYIVVIYARRRLSLNFDDRVMGNRTDLHSY